MKKCRFLGKTYKFLDFSAPYCRESKIQHPTCRVVGIPKYAPGCCSKILSTKSYFQINLQSGLQGAFILFLLFTFHLQCHYIHFGIYFQVCLIPGQQDTKKRREGTWKHYNFDIKCAKIIFGNIYLISVIILQTFRSCYHVKIYLKNIYCHRK